MKPATFWLLHVVRPLKNANVLLLLPVSLELVWQTFHFL
jgi:hypothetical protein